MKIQPPGSSHTVTNAAHVALFVAPGKDYHWYRQNPDGTLGNKNVDFYSGILEDDNSAFCSSCIDTLVNSAPSEGIS